MVRKLVLTVTMLAAVVGVSAQALQRAPRHNGAKSAVKAPLKTITPADNQLWWGYWEGTEERSGLGVQAAETYDQCIRIASNNAVVKGNTIKALRIYLTDKTNITNLKVWASTTLPTDVSAANLMVQDVDITTLEAGSDGDYYSGKANDIELTTPIAVGSQTFYVGYSFTVTSATTDATKFPIVTSITEDVNGGLYVRTSSSVTSWSNMYGEGYGNLTLSLLVEGDFLTNAAQPANFGEVVTALDGQTAHKVALTSYGRAAINSIDYTVTTGTVVGEEQHLDLTVPITQIGSKKMVAIPFAADEATGSQNKTLTITKVNGVANEYESNTATGSLTTVSRAVDRVVAVEEHTGTGCPWCPRGLVGMEKMRAKYGDKFAGIGIHGYNSSDAMYIKQGTNYANVGLSSAPSCKLDRGTVIDPYYGSSDDVCDDFDARLAVLPKAALSVTGEWSEDQKSVTAKATIEALVSGLNCTIEYVLVGDGLTGTGSAWNQSNNYASYSASQVPEDMQQFAKGGKYGKSSVTGYVFNDVALSSSYVSGKNKTTALGKLTEGTVVENTYTLALPTKTALLNAIQKDQVWVMALLVGSDKKIVNAAKFLLPDPAVNGIRNVVSDKGSMRYFTVDGREFAQPQRGLNIIRQADGRTVKVFIK